jgi:hypothetical protein
MSTSTASYHLPILVNDTQNGSTRVNENRLNLQDVFFCSEILIGWTVATATAVNGKIYTYPSITGAASTSTATALQTLYNGKLSIQVNNQNILPGWDVNRHFFAPRTQENTNFNAATATSPAQYTIDQVDLSEDAFVAVEPSWVLNGASNINAPVFVFVEIDPPLTTTLNVPVPTSLKFVPVVLTYIVPTLNCTLPKLLA